MTVLLHPKSTGLPFVLCKVVGNCSWLVRSVHDQTVFVETRPFDHHGSIYSPGIGTLADPSKKRRPVLLLRPVGITMRCFVAKYAV